MSSQVLFSIMAGKSLSALWMVINVFQLIYYSAMMTLYFPKITLALFSYLGIANFEIPIFSNIFRLHFDTSLVSNHTSWDYRFENQNVETTNILMNCSDMFLILIFIMFYNFFIFILITVCCLKNPKK